MATTKKRKPPARPDEPTQRTPGTGLEVPIPERDDFFAALRRIIRKPPPKPEPQEPSPPST
jgi:hypothetical protein